jgi:hypothetical protein
MPQSRDFAFWASDACSGGVNEEGRCVGHDDGTVEAWSALALRSAPARQDLLEHIRVETELP